MAISDRSDRTPTVSYADGMVGGSGSSAPCRWKDGRQWRIGTDADVTWIQQATAPGPAITSAIPPVFAAYTTVVVSDMDGRTPLLAH